MRLVIGGRAQGKLAYVKGQYPKAHVINGADALENTAWQELREDENALEGQTAGGALIWNHFHEFVRAGLSEGKNPEELWKLTKQRMEEAPELVILCDEIGNGIVPMEKEERTWREETGRLLCRIAAEAESVERVFCGIPSCIKRRVRIRLIRHGKTPGNEEKRYIGRTDESLSENGRSELAGKKYPAPALLFSSPMKRCLESCECLWPGRKPVVIPTLREIDFGLFEGKNYQELNGNAAYQAWIDSGGTMSFPEGEDRTAFQERGLAGFRQAIDQIRREGVTDAAMVVHGGIIMGVMEKALGGNYYDYMIPNGEGYLLTMDLLPEEYRILGAERF